MNPLLTKLCQFVGYGPEDAKVIFIGIEEHTDDDKDGEFYRQRLKIQSELETFCDLWKLCKKLKFPLYNPQNEKPQSTWSPLCSVMLGIDGKFDEIGDRQAIIDYQMNHLGRIPGDSLLAELWPVPKSSKKSFKEKIHGHLLGIPADAALGLDDYHDMVLPVRQKLLAEMVKDRFAKGDGSQPRLIVAYGKPWSCFETIFQEVRRMLKEDGPMRYNKDDHPVDIDGSSFPRFK